MPSGLISQSTTGVTVMPFGWRRTPRTLAKSTCSIIGKTLGQISSAIGLDASP